MQSNYEHIYICHMSTDFQVEDLFKRKTNCHVSYGKSHTVDVLRHVGGLGPGCLFPCLSMSGRHDRERSDPVCCSRLPTQRGHADVREWVPGEIPFDSLAWKWMAWSLGRLLSSNQQGANSTSISESECRTCSPLFESGSSSWLQLAPCLSKPLINKSPLLAHLQIHTNAFFFFVCLQR